MKNIPRDNWDAAARPTSTVDGSQMRTSPKRIAANRANSLKSTGPKTPEGKAIVGQNAVTHGLFAREVVIPSGESKEDPDEFDALLRRLREDRQPEGELEDLLVQKIAATVWRQRRLYRYEVGVTRQHLHTVESHLEGADEWRRALYRQGRGTPTRDSLPGVEHLLEALGEIRMHVQAHSQLTDEHRQWLQTYCDWTPDQMIRPDIPQTELLRELDEEREDLQRCHTILVNRRREDLIVRSARRILPRAAALDKIQRHETMLERNFSRTLGQLERLQRLRKGDFVPPPIRIDLGAGA
jgi:hypothetical protein